MAIWWGIGRGLEIHDSFFQAGTSDGNSGQNASNGVPNPMKIGYADNGASTASLVAINNMFFTDTEPFWPQPGDKDLRVSIDNWGAYNSGGYAGKIDDLHATDQAYLPQIYGAPTTVAATDPSAPTVSASGGTSTCTYQVVGATQPQDLWYLTGVHFTNPSASASTSTCVNPPTTTNPVAITITSQPGIYRWYVLSSSTRTASTSDYVGYMVCPWNGVGTTCTFYDYGQSVTAITLPGRNNTGDLTVAGISSHPIDMFSTIYSAAGTAVPACSATYAHDRLCVSDSTACTSGATYVSGGSTACELWCNATNWIESGSGC